VESNLLCLHLPVLDINLVTTKNNWDVFTDPEKSFRQKLLMVSKNHTIPKIGDNTFKMA